MLLIFQQLVHTELDVFQLSQLYPVKEFVQSQWVTEYKAFHLPPAFFTTTSLSVAQFTGFFCSTRA